MESLVNPANKRPLTTIIPFYYTDVLLNTDPISGKNYRDTGSWVFRDHTLAEEFHVLKQL